jgi:hypothetical protein
MLALVNRIPLEDRDPLSRLVKRGALCILNRLPSLLNRVMEAQPSPTKPDLRNLTPDLHFGPILPFCGDKKAGKAGGMAAKRWILEHGMGPSRHSAYFGA